MADKKHLKFLLGGIFILGIILSMWFVLATIDNPPAGITITNNVSAFYDEGNFSINWTHDVSTGDGVKNYTIVAWVNRSGIEQDDVTPLYTLFDSPQINNSVLGFSFNNYTEGNYTFMVVAMNASPVNYTGVGGGVSGIYNATRNISVVVDRTAPAINLTSDWFTNGTRKRSTETLTLNIAISDNSSGLTGS